MRFPKFRSAGGWTPRELGDCLDYRQPTQYLVASTAYNDSYEIPVVTAGKTFILGHTDETEGVFDEPLPVVIFDDFTTATQYVDFRFKAKSSAMKILLAKQNANIKFIYESMQQIDYEVGAHGRHWISAYSKIKVAVPKLDEQQKIADCLSSLDELITAQARKMDALKTHKKGLMQQLFPREGETQPRLRFPEFRDAGEWVEKKLEEITPAVFDGTHQTPTYTLEGIPFFSVENLISGNANKFISRDDYLLATKRNKPEKGDILLTRIGKIGYSQVVTWTHEFSVYVTLAVIKQSRMFDSHFLSYFVQSEFYQSELRARSLPNAVPPKINLDSLRSTKVLLTNTGEQQHIADCLNSLDFLIYAAIQELETLKIHKRGLMQQLFPTAEAVEV